MKAVTLLFTSCLAVLCSSLAFADGVYLRATGGVTSTSFDNRNTVTPTLLPKVSIDASATGFNGGLALGYGKKLNDFYIAGELRGLYDTSEAKVNTLNLLPGGPATLIQKLLYTYSASLLPGYYFNSRFLLFARLGISGGMYQSKATAGNPNLAVPGKFTRQIWGGVFGFGIQAFLTQQLALALEYNYVYYPKFSESRTVGFQKIDYDYKIRSNKGLFSLIYYFSKPPEAVPPKVIPIHQALAVDNPPPKPYSPKEAEGALAPRLSTYYEERTQRTEVAGLSEPNLLDNAFQPNHAPLPNPELLGG